MKKIFFFVAVSLLTMSVVAQQTGGVFSPEINEGREAWQYRSAFNPDNDGFAQRLHYQRAIDSDFMWRVIGQTVKTDDSDFDFDFIGAELFWELSDDDPDYRWGVRFDAQFRDDDRAQQIGFNWLNQFYFDNGWGARAILLTTVQFGENSADGIGLQTRASVSKSLSKGRSVGIEWFSVYGTTSDFSDFDDQSHALGPRYSFPIANGWSVFAGALFGVTSGAPDSELRFWLTRSM